MRRVLFCASIVALALPLAGAAAPSVQVLAKISVGKKPCAAAAGYGAIWVTNYGQGTVRVNQLAGDGRFRYLRFSDHPYDDRALEQAAETVRSLGVETWCIFSKGAADDHSPSGEPTAVTAERFSRLLLQPQAPD